MNERAVRGLRGATCADSNTKEAILAATEELLQALFQANDMKVSDIASMIFSMTEDLNAAFPAEAARKMGLQTVPLLCVREIPVPGGCPRCIRILAHVNTNMRQEDVRHIYLKEARSLRPDLEGV